MTDEADKSGTLVKVALVPLALLMLVLLLPVCGCAQTITGKLVGVSDGERREDWVVGRRVAYAAVGF